MSNNKKWAPTLRRALTGAACIIACSFTAPASIAAAPKKAATAPAQQQQRPRNIIFVLVDDLRYDGMGFLQGEFFRNQSHIFSMFCSELLDQCSRLDLVISGALRRSKRPDRRALMPSMFDFL